MRAQATSADICAVAATNGWLARRLDQRAAQDRSAGRKGPLTGLPFLAKDLFDIAGHPTVAASPSRLEFAPAREDAHAIARLRDAGAILLGTTNMDSLAYGFVTATQLYGTARNPHDPDRLCGGSSGGSAAAVAAGLVPFALGTDTSGSIRIPSALCGVPGLKPSFGRLSRSGILPLSPSLDHCGLFADSLDRLEQVFSMLDSPDPNDPHQRRFQEEDNRKALRHGLLGGHFARAMQAPVREAVQAVGTAMAADVVSMPGRRARAAAYVIVAAEAGRTHAADIRCRRETLDSAVRDRLTASLLVPRSWLADARSVAADYAAKFDALFKCFDVLLAPAVPCLAPRLDEAMGVMPGSDLPLRAALGLYTQPLSLVGLPVLSFPLPTSAGLPTAVQIIAPPGCEARLFTAARRIASLVGQAPLAFATATRFTTQPLPQDAGALAP
jgi:aspartyl-tRNA(Asn)/glutamyl-tRNA(Gln) amidotransferase subunit A